MLRIENVYKSFGGRTVLDGITLEVEAGEIVCLIGVSGSGKSTLLRCINQLEPIDDGQIWLNDVEITDPALNVDELRSRIGIVFQSYNLFPHLTVRRNIALAPIKVRGVAKRDAYDQADKLLAGIGLRDKAHSYPDSLSGGQQQRVALMRAVAMDPELLLLDEVTSALDPLLVGEVLRVVAELKTTGISMLMATHEMAFAHESADRIVFLADGQIIESGPPEQIFGDPQDERTARFLERHRAGGE